MHASRGRWTLAPHLRLLNRRLLEVAAGVCKRLVISIPVRHGKSELASHYLPAWFLGVWPEKRVILASYEAEFAAHWGGRARSVLEEYGEALFGVKVSERNRAANWWQIEGHDGYMATAGVGGPITGKGADLLLLDDPVKNAEEAHSRVIRDKQWDWWRAVAYTRLEPGGAAIVTMSRWHEDDLTGRILAEAQAGGEAWDVVRLPALAEDGDELGRRPGTALWPERYDLPRLEAIKRAVGGYTWSALYQQRPSPEGGGFFRREWFRYYTWEREGWVRLGPDDVRPISTMQRFATVDVAASTKETADWRVVASWAVTHDGYLVLLDVVRTRVEAPDIVPQLRRAYERWGLGVIAIESVAFQLAIVQEARRAGLPAREIHPDKDKVARALPATARMEAGRVWWPSSASWLGDWESEVLGFPNAEHDDQVDTLSYAVEAVRSILGMGDLERVLPTASEPPPEAVDATLQRHPEEALDELTGGVAARLGGFGPRERVGLR